MTVQTITEKVAGVAVAPALASGRRFRARLIEADVWGSCGWYSSQVLESAASDGVFHSSVPIYLDHPSASDDENRPERSVRDLAGKLTSNAVFESDGLYADVEIYPHFAPIVEAMAGDIGMSIRATAEATQGESRGRNGTIITRFHEAMSVDLVTKAGAGGKLMSLLESAHVYQIGDPPPCPQVPAGTITTNTTNVPASSAGQTTESQKGNQMHQIEEAQYAQLVAEAGKVTALIAERDTAITRADKAEADLAEAKSNAEKAEAQTAAETRVREALKTHELPPLAVERVVRESTTVIPMRDGKLDLSPFDAKVAEAIKAESDYIAALAPKSLTGFGGSTVTDGSKSTRPDPWAGRRNSGKVA